MSDKTTILVLDGEESAIGIIAMFELHSSSVEVVVCRNIAAAREGFGFRGYGLVFIDPFNGDYTPEDVREFIGWINTESPDVQVFIYTARSDSETDALLDGHLYRYVSDENDLIELLSEDKHSIFSESFIKSQL